MDREIPANVPVSMAVVRTVSALDNTEMCALPPLAETLDPDALDALFAPGNDGTGRRGGHISFVYADYRITVDNGEFLTARPVDSPDGGGSARPP